MITVCNLILFTKLVLVLACEDFGLVTEIPMLASMSNEILTSL